jgi:hypothetical protein
MLSFDVGVDRDGLGTGWQSETFRVPSDTPLRALLDLVVYKFGAIYVIPTNRVKAWELVLVKDGMVIIVPLFLQACERGQAAAYLVKQEALRLAAELANVVAAAAAVEKVAQRAASDAASAAAPAAASAPASASASASTSSTGASSSPSPAPPAPASASSSPSSSNPSTAHSPASPLAPSRDPSPFTVSSSTAPLAPSGSGQWLLGPAAPQPAARAAPSALDCASHTLLSGPLNA